jgi:hypothetical protein
MGARIRAHDWSATPLGDPSLWPPSLRTTIGILLNSGQPMCVAWGAELTLIYNDAYAAILGVRHPAALGRRLWDVWSDVWRDIASLVERAMAGESTWSEELHLTILRHGSPQNGTARKSTFPAHPQVPRDDRQLSGGPACRPPDKSPAFTGRPYATLLKIFGGGRAPLCGSTPTRQRAPVPERGAPV